MKAITIHQPWAWLIIHHPQLVEQEASGGPIKRVENRPWYTHVRETIAIHASQKIDPAGVKLAASLGINVPACRCGAHCCTTQAPDWQPAHWLVAGGIIGTVELVDCLTVEQWEAQNDWLPDPFAVGPWCHVYAHPTPLARPVPAKGQQRLWSIDPRKLPQLDAAG